MPHFLRAMVSFLLIFINSSGSMDEGEQRFFLTERILLTFAKTGTLSGNIHSTQWQIKLGILEFKFYVGEREPEPINITRQTDTETQPPLSLNARKGSPELGTNYLQWQPDWKWPNMLSLTQLVLTRWTETEAAKNTYAKCSHDHERRGANINQVCEKVCSMFRYNSFAMTDCGNDLICYPWPYLIYTRWKETKAYKPEAATNTYGHWKYIY